MSRVGAAQQSHTQTPQSAGAARSAQSKAAARTDGAKPARLAKSVAPATRDSAEQVTELRSGRTQAQKEAAEAYPMPSFLSDEIQDRMREVMLRDMTPAQQKDLDIARLQPLVRHVDKITKHLEKYPVSDVDHFLNTWGSAGVSTVGTVADLAITFEVAATAASWTAGAAAVVGAVLLLNQLGEANLAGEHEGKQRHLVRDYSQGVAAALDPNVRMKQFSDKKRAAAFFAGFTYINAMSKGEQKEMARALKREGQRLSGFDKQLVGATFANSTLNAWEFRNARYD